MADSLDARTFAQLARKIAPGGTLLRAWTLHGGVSAQVTALAIQHADGRMQKLVVRQHGAADLARNPQVAADEFTLLRVVHDAGVPAPAPCYFDQSGELFDTPIVVLEYIEGETIFALADVDAGANAPDHLSQLATQLAAIHRVDCASLSGAHLPDQTAVWTEKIRNRPPRLDDSLSEGRIRDALEAAWPPARWNLPCLLHGDYWPGNILWRDAQLVGIIDWEDAAIGDPLADVAISRLDLLWACGAEAMDMFTQRYAALVPDDFTSLPYWDLCAALRPAGRLEEWASDATAAARMRERHSAFVTEALERLSAL